MPATINTVTADKYSDAGGATIQYVYESPGGWCTCNAQVFAQLLHSPLGAQQGQEQWSDEFVLPAGAHYIQKGAIGIRFRSFTTGNPVQVTAAVFYRDEPAMVLGGSGIATPSSSVASLNFQHNDVAVATEPTADFVDQTSPATNQGILWSVVDDVANTRVKITPSFSNTVGMPGSLTTVGDQSSGSITFVVNSAVGTLMHNTGTFLSSTSSATGAAFETTTNLGDTQFRFVIDSSGTMTWGTGALARDTNWKRLAAGVIGTDNSSISTGPLNNARATVGTFDDAAGRHLATVSAVTNATFGSAVLNDTGWRISMDLNGPNNQPAMLFGSGAGVGDCTFSRQITNPTPAHFLSSVSVVIQGSTYEALTTASPVPTTSVTPDYDADTSFIYTIGGTGGGTLTINNPTNPPIASQTAWMYIDINNPPGNTTTNLTFGGAFSFISVGGAPASVLQSGFWRLFFVWRGAAWQCLIKLNA